ncbi:MAG TPA: hypothetical protein VGM90_15140 [Kofleriaceae bacterium]|jgi:hypothetical protein
MDRTKVSPRHYLAAALIGVGIAVVAYRVFGLWFHQRSVLTWFMPAFGGAFIVGGVHLGRSDTGPTGSAFLRFLLGLAAFAAAAFVMSRAMPPVGWPGFERLTWTHHQGPGFEVETPTGEHSTIETSSYAAGRIESKEIGSRNAYVAVAWTAGQTLTEATLDIAVQAAGATGAASQRTVYSETGDVVMTRSSTLDSGLAFWISAVRCSDRNVLVSSAMSADDIEAVHSRVVRSFHCLNEPAPAQSLGRVHVALDLPTFKASLKQPGLVELLDGNRILLLQEMAYTNGFDLHGVKAAVGAMGTDVQVDNEVDGRFPFRVTLGTGAHATGWMTAKICDDKEVMLMAVSVNNASLDDVTEAQQNARCLEPGEEPQDWPSTDAVANADAESRDVASLHIAFKLPFDVVDRKPAGLSFAHDDSYISVNEMDRDVAWDASSIIEHARLQGFEIEKLQRHADGRWSFRTSGADSNPHLPGWFATKVCGDHQIAFVTASASAAEQKQILKAYQTARCTDEVMEY